MARPIVALVVDGAYYDIAALEAMWGIRHDFSSSDFHSRVVAARCAGLAELEARLLAGPRPTEARLKPKDFLPLPPCDGERAAYVRLASEPTAAGEPLAQLRDARALIGDGQPVPIVHGALGPTVEAGFALLLSDDLWRASAREAARAIAGFTLLLDWGPAGVVHASSQLGPELLVRCRARDLAQLSTRLVVAGNRRDVDAIGTWRLHPAEALAFISQSTQLRAGDVVGLGGVEGGRAPTANQPLAYGDRVRFVVPRFMRLEGWATAGPKPRNWRM